MPDRTLWQAVACPRFLRSVWPWRAVLYVLTGAVVGVLVLVGLTLAVVVAGAGAVVVVGLPLLPALGLAGLPVGRWERRRLALVGGPPVADPHEEPETPGLWAWVRTRYREGATWRELGYAVLLAGLLWPLDALVVVLALGVPAGLAAVPVLMATAGGGAQASVLKQWTVTSWPVAFAVAALGVLLLAAGLYAVGVYAAARAEPARLLLAPREPGGAELGVRVAELTSSRARLVDAFEAERRRIERDLHDGAQQRLVALTMTLGLARLDAPPGPLAGQLATAHTEAGLALGELRELIHGIHPKVLTDYGLPAAVADAADRAVVPVDIELGLPGRLPQPVESAAYFVVCEALTNVDRHSGASRAVITGGYLVDRLWLEIRDDGCGGAEAATGAGAGAGSGVGPDPDAAPRAAGADAGVGIGAGARADSAVRRGTGLTGLADRVAVLDGRLSLSSPPGGPTLLRVEIPCEWTEPSG
ncbi:MULTISPECIES: sensor histidine kinase [Streptomyces]|uniref:sensor histidine kinase n=1 Tax=Streptomyces TaxID=1883 RepID=UPI0005F81932|nr:MULTISPECIES: sensor histidine kinase [Streptomyces]AZK94533.1 sensor histidine kinase [Streptomyces tsukubensis]MYS67488.1 sensor histidine kinase [Streptomyces sp. SID5473]